MDDFTAQIELSHPNPERRAALLPRPFGLAVGIAGLALSSLTVGCKTDTAETTSASCECAEDGGSGDAGTKQADASTASEPPPSTTGATYVEPSAEDILEPGTKIGDLFELNMSQPYVLQRLSERAYWVQSQNYGTIFYVGDEGVLIFDPLEGVYDNVVSAVASVTDLPIVAAVYPHYHADHIGDIARYVEAAEAEGIELSIIASDKSARSMELADSSYPRPTQELTWPQDSFTFEGLTVEMHGFEHAAHCDDHAAFLLKEDRIVHVPDLLNPDQPPFYKFGGNERYRFHKDNVEAVGALEWDYLSGSHGNIGSRADIDFELKFAADLEAAVGQAMQAHPFSEFVDPSASAHTEFLANYFHTVAREATETLRPEYGEMYGFDAATPSNAELVAWVLFEYR